jgi:hypothetical protein
VLHDNKIDKLQIGTPDDARDIIDVNKDVVELFLDPGRSGKAYYQFMTTPLGARYDMRITPEGRRDKGLYTPEWKVAPHIAAEYWAVEFRIPFSELVFDHGYIGTPQIGDEWGINFCRDQGYRKEWSFWSPHKDKSFHRPTQFGTAIFKGRKDGKKLTKIQWVTNTELAYGKGELKLVSDSDKNLLYDWQLYHNRQLEKKPQKAEALTYKYQIISGGEWDVQVTIKQEGKDIFYGRVKNKLFPIKELVDSVYKNITEAQKKVSSGINNKAILGLKKELQELETLVVPLHKELEYPEKLTLEKWNELEKLIPGIEAKWQPLKYAIEVIKFYPAESSQEQSFAVSTANPAERIYQDTIIPPKQKPVELWGAGGERESFQILLMPFLDNVKGVKISFTDLKGAKNTLPASCFEYSVVGFVKMHESWGGKWVPDVLYPGKIFELHKNKTQPVWIDVQIPRGIAPGVYQGTVNISANGQTAHVPVKVYAFGFDIPEKRSISTDPWYWPDERGWRKYYKLKKIPFTPELYEKHLKVLSKYRYGCYPLETVPMWEMLKIYQEENGSLTFDFSGWDWVFEMGQKYGADNLGASFGCNFNALRPTFSGKLNIYDRKTGKKITTPGKYANDIAKWKYVRGETKKSDFMSNPVYRQYISQLVDYLRAKGLLKNSHYEIYDEPKTGTEWQDVLRMHGFLKEFVPELKLKSYGVGPWAYEHRPELRPFGYYDVWAPGLYTITPERLKLLHERQQKGEEFWFYTCSAGYRDYDRKTIPHICLYQHPLAPRMHGWAAWKLKADGFLIFALMSGHPQNVQTDESKFYTEPIWHGGKTAMQGVLVYPGSDLEMIPSIRLSALRDGLEDYEYFKILSEKLKELDSAKHPQLVKSIKAELEIGDDIMPWDWREWTRDFNKLEARRIKLGTLIEKADLALSKMKEK